MKIACSDIQKCLKPLTANNLLFHYNPIVGAGSHTFLAVNVLNPAFCVNFLSKRDLTNILIASSLFGTGCYLFNKHHLSLAPKNDKIIFATYGATMFTFSSILLWAILRSFLPQNGVLCTAAGVASSYALIKIGQKYVAFIDGNVVKK